jgi:hypothetical protein
MVLKKATGQGGVSPALYYFNQLSKSLLTDKSS